MKAPTLVGRAKQRRRSEAPHTGKTSCQAHLTSHLPRSLTPRLKPMRSLQQHLET